MDVKQDIVIQKYKYSKVCIPSKAFRETNALEPIPFGCGCLKSCEDEETCLCLAQHNCFYVDDHLCDLNNKEPLFECNECCSCSNECRNRLVQLGSKYVFQVFQTENKGFGLKSTMHVTKGSFVIEYVGELLTETEAKTRMSKYTPHSSCYLYALREFFGDKKTSHFIDASKVGNESRFINHSCDPNLIMIPVRVNTLFPHFTLFALKDIPLDGELTFDYGVQHMDKVDEQKQCRCLCSSSNCCGVLPFDQGLFL